MFKRSLTLALLATACSDSSSDGADASVSPTSDAAVVSADGMQANLEHCGADDCGGDLVGHWVFDQACSERIRPEPVADDCGTQLYSNRWLSGEISFSSDGTAEVTTQIIDETYMWVPRMCRPLLSSCDQAVQFTPPITGSCTEVDGVCDCIGRNIHPESTSVLPYRSEEDQFAITTDDGDLTFGYCAGPGGLRYTSESGEVVTAHRVD